LYADFALKIQVLGFEHVEALEKLAIEDRASARQRGMTVRHWTPAVLGYIVTVGFFGLLAYLATHDVPNTSERIIPQDRAPRPSPGGQEMTIPRQKLLDSRIKNRLSTGILWKLPKGQHEQVDHADVSV
jgi:hypothetical protein